MKTLKYQCRCGIDHAADERYLLKKQIPSDRSYVLDKLKKRFCNCCGILVIVVIWLLPFWIVGNQYQPVGTDAILSSMLGTFCYNIDQNCHNKTINATQEWSHLRCMTTAFKLKNEIISSGNYEHTWSAYLFSIKNPFLPSYTDAIRNAAQYMSDTADAFECDNLKKCYPWSVVTDNLNVEEPTE